MNMTKNLDKTKLGKAAFDILTQINSEYKSRTSSFNMPKPKLSNEEVSKIITMLREAFIKPIIEDAVIIPELADEQLPLPPVEQAIEMLDEVDALPPLTPIEDTEIIPDILDEQLPLPPNEQASEMADEVDVLPPLTHIEDAETIPPPISKETSDIQVPPTMDKGEVDNLINILKDTFVIPAKSNGPVAVPQPTNPIALDQTPSLSEPDINKLLYILRDLYATPSAHDIGLIDEPIDEPSSGSYFNSLEDAFKYSFSAFKEMITPNQYVEKDHYTLPDGKENYTYIGQVYMEDKDRSPYTKRILYDPNEQMIEVIEENM